MKAQYFKLQNNTEKKTEINAIHKRLLNFDHVLEFGSREFPGIIREFQTKMYTNIIDKI